jgi:hypothetical protein
VASNHSTFVLRRKIDALLHEHAPLIQDAFLVSIVDIRSQITLKLLEEALERGDIAGAIEALQIERSAFGPLELAIAEAYNAGGINFASSLVLRDPSGSRIAFRFGVRNPEAEAWLLSHSAALVNRIVEDQRQGIRTALAEGLARGDNPRRTALDVVGRVNRVTGRREGGIIGLTAPQERFVASAREELLSGVPEALKNYLGRERRDRRFDALVRKAIAEGRALDRATVERMVGRYADRLLDLRGEMLSRTETMIALGKSRDDAIGQAIAAGKVDPAFVTKRWRSASDDRVRHSHRALNGDEIGFYTSFQSPTGASLRFPGDPDAPISETSGCRCTVEYKVDYTAQLLARRRAA